MTMMKPALALVLALIAVPGVALSAETAAEKKPSSSQTPSTAQGGKGFVTIACNPTCDNVAIAGRSLGPSPIVRAAVDPGTHTVTLKRNNAPDMEITVVVIEGQIAARSVKLPTPPPPSAAPPPEIAALVASKIIAADGFVTVMCEPGCDEMIIDGKRKLGRGQLTNVSVSPGNHEITLKHKGQPDKLMKVVIAPGQTTAFRVHMVPVLAAPAGAVGDEKALRKKLEPKVWAGKATAEEKRMLKAICSHQGDIPCRDRAEAMITGRQTSKPTP
jgi:hypothetical protein